MALARWRRVPISGETYKQIGRASAGAVSIVAAVQRGSDTVVGLTVSSFVTLSFDPPLVMFAIQYNADSYATLVASESFGVSLLSVHQADVAQRFSHKGREKCVNTRFETGLALPVPLIAESLAQVECRTRQIFSSGDHAIVVGLVEAARTREGEPLLYFARRYGSFAPLADA
jgi:flavin reductase (DIM6/NTAB) family NADH-FMN oxidoreductase RutF